MKKTYLLLMALLFQSFNTLQAAARATVGRFFKKPYVDAVKAAIKDGESANSQFKLKSLMKDVPPTDLYSGPGGNNPIYFQYLRMRERLAGGPSDLDKLFSSGNSLQRARSMRKIRIGDTYRDNLSERLQPYYEEMGLKRIKEEIEKKLKARDARLHTMLRSDANALRRQVTENLGPAEAPKAKSDFRNKAFGLTVLGSLASSYYGSEKDIKNSKKIETKNKSEKKYNQ